MRKIVLQTQTTLDGYMSGPDGAMDIWLDEADQLVLRMIVDLTWVEVQEDESYSRSTYNISAIGETEDIEPPI